MAKYPRVVHLYQDVYEHTVRVVATSAEGNGLPISELNRPMAGGLTRPWLCSTPVSGG